MVRAARVYFPCGCTVEEEWADGYLEGLEVHVCPLCLRVAHETLSLAALVLEGEDNDLQLPLDMK